MNKPPAIFIHSLFRTGSTYIWNKFRQNPSYYCYYEPFHHDLIHIGTRNPSLLKAENHVTDMMHHPNIDKNYMDEYIPLLNPDHEGVPLFKKTFTFDDFCRTDENPDQRQYVNLLLEKASPHIPVLQFNRSGLRIKWFKQYFPGAFHFYLARNPRHQFQSYEEMARKNNLDVFLVMDLILSGVNASSPYFQPLGTRIPLFEFHYPRFADEYRVYKAILPTYSIEERYFIFYYIWFSALVENSMNADMLLDIERLSDDSSYRSAIENVLRDLRHPRVDFSDARIARYDSLLLSDSQFREIEAEARGLVLDRIGEQSAALLSERLDKESRKSFDLAGCDLLQNPGVITSSQPFIQVNTKSFSGCPGGQTTPTEPNTKITNWLIKPEPLEIQRRNRAPMQWASRKEPPGRRRQYLERMQEAMLSMAGSLVDRYNMQSALEEKMAAQNRFFQQKERELNRELQRVLQEKNDETRSYRQKLSTGMHSTGNGDGASPLEGGLRTRGQIKELLSSNPPVSVVTVVRNDAEALEKTICSVLEQKRTYDNLEFIVIDGASTDRTVEIIKKYEEGIDYWISERDSGIYNAMNKGVRLSTGLWINFLNAGDYFYEPSTVQAVFNCNYGDAHFLYGHTYFLGGDFTGVVKTWGFNILWKTMIFTHQSLFTRRSVLLDHPFDTSFKICADYQLIFDSYMKGLKFFNTDVVIAAFHPGTSDMNRSLMAYEKWKAVRKYRDDLTFHYFYLKLYLKRFFPWIMKRIFRRSGSKHPS